MRQLRTNGLLADRSASRASPPRRRFQPPSIVATGTGFDRVRVAAQPEVLPADGSMGLRAPALLVAAAEPAG
jgi:hypothetical protein